MTHSHDTATPALSVESEYVLVPREPTKAMIAAALNVNLTNEDEIADAYNIYHSMIAAAPAPNPSPAAKGGEAEALTEAMDFIKRYARHDGSCLTGREGDYGERTCECDFNSKRVRLRAKIAALATPSPQPADAVRDMIVAMRDKHGNANGTGYEQGVWDQSQRILSKFAALATPSPQPANTVPEADSSLPGMDWELSADTKARMSEIDRLAGEALSKTSSIVIGALATPSPQPADAVREALPCPFCGSPAKLISTMGEWVGGEDGYGPEGARYVCSTVFIADCPAGHSFHGPNQEAEALAAWNTRAALASDPAPAGEAVEPDDLTAAYMAGVERGREDTARLREDLAEANERANANAYDRFVWKERAVTAERERDDARKALEPFARQIEDISPDEADMDAYTVPNARYRKGPKLTVGHMRAAARSASREGASDE